MIRTLHCGKSIENFKLQLQEKNGQISEEYQAENDWVMADDVHFINLISNFQLIFNKCSGCAENKNTQLTRPVL